MLYAAYGSNLHPLRLRWRLPAVRFIGTAAVPGWRLRFHKRSIDVSGKCNIVRSAGRIHVAVYDLDASSLQLLDVIEGAGYKRRPISVPDFGDCHIYVAAACHIDDALLPYAWYRELVLLGAERHGFPDTYRSAIDRIPTIPDPDAKRARKQQMLITEMRLRARGPNPERIAGGRRR